MVVTDLGGLPGTEGARVPAPEQGDQRQWEDGLALLPRVHRWPRCSSGGFWTHIRGPSVSRDHLDYYVDKFTFRFNRRTSKRRGKLFFRLVEQTVVIDPATFAQLVTRSEHNP